MESKKYFIIVDRDQKGPLSFSELELLNLKNDTPVWFEGMSEWSVLEKVEELKSLKKTLPPVFNDANLSSIPPQYSTSVSNDEDENVSFFQKNKTIIIILVFVLGLALAFPLFSSSKDEKLNGKSNSSLETTSIIDSVVSEKQEISKQDLSPEELRNELLKKEQDNPLDYLTVSSTFKENKVKTRNGTLFRSSEWKIDGHIADVVVSNSSTLAIYRDIKVKIKFISQTGSEIESTEFIIYDYVNPNQTINSKNKVYLPEGTVTYEISILNASS